MKREHLSNLKFSLDSLVFLEIQRRMFMRVKTSCVVIKGHLIAAMNEIEDFEVCKSIKGG